MSDNYIEPQGQDVPAPAQRRRPADAVPVKRPNDLVPVPSGESDKPEQPGIGTSLWQGLLHGLGNPVMGVRQLDARLRRGLGMQGETPQAADQAAMQREQQYRGPFAPGPGQALSPARANPVSAGIGEIGGEAVTTAPLAAISGGTGLGARAALGALGGGLAGATNPVVSGRDFWTEKATQAGLGAAAGGAMGAAGGVLNPRLGPDAAALAQRGVSLTPGQRLGAAGAERKLQAFPILRGFVESNVDRSVDGFNRAAVRQALEPIGAVMPRAVKPGHDMIAFMKDKISDAYDRVLPMLAPADRATVKTALDTSPELQRMIGEMASDDARRFDTMLNNRILDRFDKATGAMDGPLFKKVDRDLGSHAISMARGNKEISDGLILANQILRDEVKKAQVNPALSGYLDNIDHAWAMSVRLDKAAAHRADSEARFTPSDMLMAIKESDASRNHTAFAKGDALMQEFAEQANRVLGRSVRRYEDPSAGSQIAGAVPGASAALPYWAVGAAQRHPAFGGAATMGAPAAGDVAGRVVSRAPEDKEKPPRIPSAGP